MFVPTDRAIALMHILTVVPSSFVLSEHLLSGRPLYVGVTVPKTLVMSSLITVLYENYLVSFWFTLCFKNCEIAYHCIMG